MAETATPTTGSKRMKSWTSSERRQRSEMFGIRLRPGQRQLLDAEAARRGFRSAQEMVLAQFAPILTSAE